MRRTTAGLFCKDCIADELVQQPSLCPLCETAFTVADIVHRDNDANDEEDIDDDHDHDHDHGKQKRKGGQDQAPVKKRKTQYSKSPKQESKIDSLKSELLTYTI